MLCKHSFHEHNNLDHNQEAIWSTSVSDYCVCQDCHYKKNLPDKFSNEGLRFFFVEILNNSAVGPPAETDKSSNLWARRGSNNCVKEDKGGELIQWTKSSSYLSTCISVSKERFRLFWVWSRVKETMIHYTHIGHHEMNDTQLKARLKKTHYRFGQNIAQYTSRAYNLIKDYDNWCGSGPDRYHCLHHLPCKSTVQTLL